MSNEKHTNNALVYRTPNRPHSVYMRQADGTFASLGLAYFEDMDWFGAESLYNLLSRSSFGAVSNASELPDNLQLFAEVTAEGHIVYKANEWFGMTEGDMIDELVEREAQTATLEEAQQLVRDLLRAKYDSMEPADVREAYTSTFGGVEQ